MKTDKVTVFPYDEKWKNAFEEIKLEILNCVNDLIVSIEHVGSTSVEGMSAKPCIDIDIVIKDYSVFEKLKDRLATIGYIYEGDLGIKDREAFRYKNKEHLMAHHLYVCPSYSKELNRHITFRNYLRNNPNAIKRYSKVKEKGAKLYPNDIDKYIEYKTPIIEELYRECGLL